MVIDVYIEPEEFHNYYYGLDEENGEEFNNQWGQYAKEANLDKLRSQLKNQKQMLEDLKGKAAKYHPQMSLGSHTPVQPSRREQPLQLESSAVHHRTQLKPSSKSINTRL